MTENKHYIFLLVGKTGCGRSATANSILGENYFVSGDKGSSTTRQISSKTIVRNELKVTVIDTPGIMDSSVSGTKTKACTDLTAAMRECPSDGKLAIVLALKYGQRFTEENRQTVYILKNIFGDTDMWKSCIIIMTHGDNFQVNNEDGIAFESWSRSQRGELGKVFKDCSYRCLIYNNRTNHPEEKKHQFEKLIQLADLIVQEYTMPTFLAAKTRQNRLLLEEKLTGIEKNFDMKINDLLHFANSLSERDDKYVAFINSINDVTEELNAIDNQRLIYYARGEMPLLNKQRKDLNDIKEDVEIKVTLNDLEKKSAEKKLPDYTEVTDMEVSIKELETKLKLKSKCKFRKYKGRISSLKEKVNFWKQENIRIGLIIRCIAKMVTIAKELDNLPIPTAVDKLLDYLKQVERLSLEVAALEHNKKHEATLLPCVDRLRQAIEWKINESYRVQLQRTAIFSCLVLIVIGVLFAIFLR